MAQVLQQNNTRTPNLERKGAAMNRKQHGIITSTTVWQVEKYHRRNQLHRPDTFEPQAIPRVLLSPWLYGSSVAGVPTWRSC